MTDDLSMEISIVYEGKTGEPFHLDVELLEEQMATLNEINNDRLTLLTEEQHEHLEGVLGTLEKMSDTVLDLKRDAERQADKETHKEKEEENKKDLIPYAASLGNARAALERRTKKDFEIEEILWDEDLTYHAFATSGAIVLSRQTKDLLLFVAPRFIIERAIEESKTVLVYCEKEDEFKVFDPNEIMKHTAEINDDGVGRIAFLSDSDTGRVL